MEKIKKGDRIKIEVIVTKGSSIPRILSTSKHIVDEDEKGLFVINQSFKLHLKDVSAKMTILK